MAWHRLERLHEVPMAPLRPIAVRLALSAPSATDLGAVPERNTTGMPMLAKTLAAICSAHLKSAIRRLSFFTYTVMPNRWASSSISIYPCFFLLPGRA